MTDLKISQLPNGGTITSGDTVPVVRAGANYGVNVGSAATQSTGTFLQAANNLGDLGDLAAAQATLGIAQFKTANVLAYGAICDGITHPLSNYYATLAAAQVVYPTAQSLSDEIDMVALEKAWATGRPVYIPNNSNLSTAALLINRQVNLPYSQSGRQGYILMYGDGSSTNGRRYGSTIRRTVSNAGINIIGVSRTTAPNSNDLFKYPRIYGICLDGGWTQYNTNADYPMLNMNAVYECIFNDMTVVNTLGHGILMREVWDSRFHDIRLQTCGQHQGYQKSIAMTSGSTTATVDSTTGLFEGQRIYGTGLESVVISSILTSTTFRLSTAANFTGSRTCAFEAKAAIHICSNSTTTATSNNLVMNGFRIEACPGSIVRVQGINIVDIWINDFKAENNEMSMDSAIDIDGASIVEARNAWVYGSPYYYDYMSFSITTAGKTLASIGAAWLDSFTFTDMYYPATGTLTSGSDIITGLPDTSTLKIGQFIGSTGISTSDLSGPCVKSIISATEVEMTVTASASSAGTKALEFYYPYDSGVFYRRGFYTNVPVLCWDADDPRNLYMGRVCSFGNRTDQVLSLAVEHIFGDTSKSITNWRIAMAHAPMAKFRNTNLCRGEFRGVYPGGVPVTQYPYLQAFTHLHNVNCYRGETFPTSGYQLLPGNSFQAYTSSTSLTIGTGNKTFTVATGIPADVFPIGQPIYASGNSVANAEKQMIGVVIAPGYNSGTGSLPTNITDTQDSGTLSSWIITNKKVSAYLQTGTNVDVISLESHYVYGTPAASSGAVAPMYSDTMAVNGGKRVKGAVATTAGIYAKNTPDSETLYCIRENNGTGGGIYLGSTSLTSAPDVLTINSSPADLGVSGTVVSFTAGENLAFGDPVYIESDDFAWKADANAAGKFPAIGIAAATILSAASGNILLFGVARNDAWSWAVGDPIYLSTSAGLTQTQPTTTDDCIQVLGTAIAATKILFRPSPDFITHT